MTTKNELQSNTLHSPGRLSLFSKQKMAVISLWNRIARKHKTCKRLNLYTACSNTPLDVFIDCLVNNNLRRLIIHGHYESHELNRAWQRIWHEYCELSGNNQFLSAINLIKKAGYLKGRLFAIQLACQVLSLKHDEFCIEYLKKQGYNYNFDHNDPEYLQKDLDTVIRRTASIELEIMRTEKEIQKIEETSGGRKVDESYFNIALSRLSKYQGYHIDRSKTMVSEFIVICKDYEREIEALANKK